MTGGVVGVYYDMKDYVYRSVCIGYSYKNVWKLCFWQILRMSENFFNCMLMMFDGC